MLGDQSWPEFRLDFQGRCQDIFDNRSPNYAGDVGIGINPKLAQRVKDADVLLVIGARLGEMTTSAYTLVEAPVPGGRMAQRSASRSASTRSVRSHVKSVRSSSPSRIVSDVRPK